MNTPNIETLNSSNCTERSIKIHYSEFWEYLKSMYPDLSWPECLYWYYHKLSTFPVCVCGNKTKFINFKQGYREFCCPACVSKYSQLKKEQTCIKHYGVKNPAQSKEIQEKIRQTTLEKYGVENIFQSETTKQSIKDSNNKSYGVDYPLQSNEYKDHYKALMQERYGVDWNSQIKEVRLKKRDNINETIKKGKDTFKSNFLSAHPNIIDFDDTYYICRCNHLECNGCTSRTFKIPKQIYHSRKPQGIELCTTLKPVNDFNKNTSIESFVKSILDEHNIYYTTSDRSIISPQELDIYIPDKKIAIECNGCYWHSSIYKDSRYHNNKYTQCKHNGVQLLNIWEDWIINKPDIVESIILSKIGIYKNKIYARKCQVVKVNSNDSSEFLSKNHIQGSCRSSMRYGLLYNERLVALMTFGKKRGLMMGHQKRSDTWELMRFCTELNTTVVGGASKLLSHFIKDTSAQIIESFSSHDISNGGLYKNLGFVEESQSGASYWYIDKNLIRYHRFTFNKQSLIKQGFDKTLTEEQIMMQRGFLKIYDSGQTKWILNKNDTREI